MPTVPFGRTRVASAVRPKIDETYLAMAASDLHDAGMLFEERAEPVQDAIRTGAMDPSGLNATDFTRRNRR